MFLKSLVGLKGTNRKAANWRGFPNCKNLPCATVKYILTYGHGSVSRDRQLGFPLDGTMAMIHRSFDHGTHCIWSLDLAAVLVLFLEGHFTVLTSPRNLQLEPSKGVGSQSTIFLRPFRPCQSHINVHSWFCYCPFCSTHSLSNMRRRACLLWHVPPCCQSSFSACEWQVLFGKEPSLLDARGKPTSVGQPQDAFGARFRKCVKVALKRVSIFLAQSTKELDSRFGVRGAGYLRVQQNGMVSSMWVVQGHAFSGMDFGGLEIVWVVQI